MTHGFQIKLVNLGFIFGLGQINFFWFLDANNGTWEPATATPNNVLRLNKNDRRLVIVP